MGIDNNDDTSHYEGAILEDIQHQVQRLAEAMAEVPQDVRQLKTDMSDVKQDVQTIKAVITDHNKVLDSQDQRISRMEERTV